MKLDNFCCLPTRLPPKKKTKNGSTPAAAALVIPTQTGIKLIALFILQLHNVFPYSSIPEWESSIDENTGELLYIDCHPHVTQNTSETPVKFATAFVKSPVRQSTRSKFLRLIRRRESKRRSKHWSAGQIDNITNKVKFQVIQSKA